MTPTPSPLNMQLGMELRDLFANTVLGACMQNAKGLGEMSTEKRAELLKAISILIYEIADAMMEARQR